MSGATWPENVSFANIVEGGIHFGRGSKPYPPIPMSRNFLGLQGTPHRESGQSLCVRDRRDKPEVHYPLHFTDSLDFIEFSCPRGPSPNFVDFHKRNRVGSRTEINLFTNGLRMRSSKESRGLIPELRVNIKLHAVLDPSKHKACIGLKIRNSRELSNFSCVKKVCILITIFRHVMNTHRLNYPTNHFTFKKVQRIGPLTNIFGLHPTTRSQKPSDFPNQVRG